MFLQALRHSLSTSGAQRRWSGSYQSCSVVDGNCMMKSHGDLHCSGLNILCMSIFNYHYEGTLMIRNTVISFYFSVSQDLKDEKQKARMAAARAVLEKCTMMLLTASKVCEVCV